VRATSVYFVILTNRLTEIAADDALDAAPAAFLKLLIDQGARHRGDEETQELAKVTAAP